MSDDILKPGEWCDGNEIVRLVGRGGHAEVYEARESGRARRAIKILTADPELARKLHARFAQEAHSLSLIEHPNVVRLFRVGMYRRRLYLLLEFVDGRSLFTRMQHLNGLVPIEDCLRWMHSACLGVEAAHKQGIVHRDLKPSNILVTDTDVVKVIDFGVAKLRDCGVQTTPEETLGTALYMAPDLMQNGAPSPLTDVYSMGMILYEALAGHHPIGPGAKTMAQVITWQLTARPRPLREVAPEVPGNVEFLVHRALDKDPARRQKSAEDLAKDLHNALSSMRVDFRREVLRVMPSTDPRLVPTAAMPARDSPVIAQPPMSGGPNSTPTGARPTGVGGTVAMAAVAPPARPPTASSAPGHRASAESASSSSDTTAAGHAATLQDRTAYLPASPTAAQVPARPPRPQLLLAATVSWDAAAPLPGGDQVSDAPVESTVAGAPRRSSRIAVGVATAVGVVVALLVGGWFIVVHLFGEVPPRAAASSTPMPPVVSAPSVQAPPPPVALSASAGPSASAAKGAVRRSPGVRP